MSRVITNPNQREPTTDEKLAILNNKLDSICRAVGFLVELGKHQSKNTIIASWTLREIAKSTVGDPGELAQRIEEELGDMKAAEESARRGTH